MSTKTTFKRIALVAVASLGFGLLSAVPSRAVDGVSAGAIALDNSFLTVVQGANNAGVVRISLTDIDGNRDTLTAGVETITATVIGVPAVDTKTVANNASDITFQELRETTAGAKDYVVDSVSAQAASHFQDGVIEGRTASRGNTPVSNGATSNAASVYAIALIGSTTAGISNTINKGAYTVRFRLTDGTGFVLSEKTIQIRWVSAAAESGAVITSSVTGSIQKGQAISFTTNNRVSVTLRDANGGRIQQAPGSGVWVPVAPTLSAALTDSLGAVATTGAFTLNDTGTDAQDIAVGTSATTAATLNSSLLDGVYGLTAASTALDTATPALTNQLRVRYGATEHFVTVPHYDATTASATVSTMTVAATGISVLNTATPFKLPISTKSAVFTVTALTSGSVAVTNIPISFTVAYSGNVNSGDLTPVASKVTTVMTDAFGQASFTVTNANPINGGVATVTASGFAAAGTKAVALNWELPKATTILISPASSKVALKAATVVTATVLDQFGKPVADEVLQPSVTGANAPATGTTIATIKTGAAGTATYTVTDAKAVEASTTLGTDAVNFTAASNAVSGTAVTYTYVATLPVIAAFAGFYDLAETTTAASRVTPVPSTGIYNGTSRLLINDAREINGILTSSGSVSNELVAYRFNATSSASAAVSGVIVTATITDGGYFINSSNLKTSTLTLVTSTTGDVSFVAGTTKIGANTITVTSGSTTGTASFWAGNATADARYVTMTGAATATANGALVPVTVTVTDRYANPVSGVALSLTATGAAAFAGGATTQTYTTDAAGTFTFQGTSYNTAGGAGSFKASVTTTGTSVSDAAGYVGATAVDSTLTAGASSATLAVTFAEGVNPAEAAAQAASDAAAEATDAANAATDAANAAAEAADAATAAAQDAADAVAALSTQVSEMVNALKKQITALTNLVIKIQKKVRA
jgi:trimeric autotransporter adhesin